ncbi:hypothetical protein Dsin_000608 [Dipteronia sinensis]|uniref:Sulfotransferase n=1 Tax=Dipteronia sinensis TaxID=43782 RepID=A0AAE0EI71_9ROSI|nr:hypothetical protein Dsin_000608 [Dipteronia sinensis]
MPSSTTIITTASTVITPTHFTKHHQKIVAEAEEKEEKEVFELLSQECKELLLSLPKEKGWRTPFLYQFEGFWCQPKEIQSIISFQKHFKSKESDVILATIPKSGTTWLKALGFAIINRKRYSNTQNHPLLTSNPHDLVPFLEYKLYANNQLPDLSNVFPNDHDHHPRTFATHVPFPSLEESIKKSENVKIVYLCRNPFDTFISSWHFINKLRLESLPGKFSLEDAFKMYCSGVVGFGPFWEHMLGYWNESLKRPKKVLFLKYEDMTEDIESNLKELANFLGFPFSVEEERENVIEEIAKLCSFDKLKELEVNKSGKAMTFSKQFENKHLFRKGIVGDWVNYLSASMVNQLSQLMEEKFEGSGLSFKLL